MACLDGQRILIVEDEGVIAMWLEGLVQQLGGEVVGPTASVAEALRLADEGPLDGAVLDVNVAGIPVYSVADRLALRQVPFVFLTGHAEAVPPAYADRRLLAKPPVAVDVTRLLAEIFGLEASGDCLGGEGSQKCRVVL